MIEDIKILLDVGMEGILKSPQHTISLMRCYSILFLNGGQCNHCEASLRQYYEKLKRTTMTKIELLEQVAKRTCKPCFKGLFYSTILNAHVMPETLTDEKAIEYLERGILKESHFEVLPVNYKKPQNVNIERPEILVTEDIKDIPKPKKHNKK